MLHRVTQHFKKYDFQTAYVFVQHITELVYIIFLEFILYNCISK